MWEIINQVVLFAVIAAIVLIYGYLFSLVCSTAYFKAKLIYQNSFFRKFDPNHNTGEK